jgi:hypothetical protein
MVTAKRNYKAPLRIKRRYWNGFYPDGTQKWFLELNNGVILVDKKEAL